MFNRYSEPENIGHGIRSLSDRADHKARRRTASSDDYSLSGSAILVTSPSYTLITMKDLLAERNLQIGSLILRIRKLRVIDDGNTANFK